jgi:hypothetical protein
VSAAFPNASFLDDRVIRRRIVDAKDCGRAEFRPGVGHALEFLKRRSRPARREGVGRDGGTGDEFVLLRGGHHIGQVEIPHVDVAGPVHGSDRDRPVERGEYGRVVSGRVGLRDPPTERPDVSDRRARDLARCVGEDGEVPPDRRRARDRAVPGHGPDLYLRCPLLDVVQFRHLVEVDEVIRCRQPVAHLYPQGLVSGEKLGVVEVCHE